MPNKAERPRLGDLLDWPTIRRSLLFCHVLSSPRSIKHLLAYLRVRSSLCFLPVTVHFEKFATIDLFWRERKRQDKHANGYIHREWIAVFFQDQLPASQVPQEQRFTTIFTIFCLFRMLWFAIQRTSQITRTQWDECLSWFLWQGNWRVSRDVRNFCSEFGAVHYSCIGK